MVSLRRNKLNTVGASEGATKTYVRSKVNELGIVRHAPMTEDYYPIITDEEHSAKGMTNSPMYRSSVTSTTTLPDTLAITGDPGLLIGQAQTLLIKGDSSASAGRDAGRLTLGADGDGGLITNLGTSKRSLSTLDRSPLQIGGVDALGESYEIVPCWSFWFEARTDTGDKKFIVQLPDNPVHGDVYWLNFAAQGSGGSGSDDIGYLLKPSTTPAGATTINGSVSNLVAVEVTALDLDVNLWRVQYIVQVSHAWDGWFAQKMTSSFP